MTTKEFAMHYKDFFHMWQEIRIEGFVPRFKKNTPTRRLQWMLACPFAAVDWSTRCRNA